MSPIKAESETNRNLRFSIFLEGPSLVAGSNESVEADRARNVTVCLKKSDAVSMRSLAQSPPPIVCTAAIAQGGRLVGSSLFGSSSDRSASKSLAVSRRSKRSISEPRQLRRFSSTDHQTWTTDHDSATSHQSLIFVAPVYPEPRRAS